METTTTTHKIVVCGSNLRARDATFHVHAPGCKDLRNYGPGRKMGGDDGGWEIEVESDDFAYEASRAVYEDHISDYGYEYDSPEAVEYWRNASSEFKVFPCVRKAVA